MSKTILVALSALIAGIAMAHVWYQATGYREVHFSECNSNGPLVLEPGIAAASLNAFIWGYGKGPVELIVRMGEGEVDKTVLVPDDEGALYWDYHGDWYDDFIIEFKGDNCKLNVTYRL